MSGVNREQQANAGAEKWVPSATERLVVAFIGRSERGPANQARPVHSFQQFRGIFGDHVAFSHMSHAVQQFFLHGGRTAVIVRVVSRATSGIMRLTGEEGVLELAARNPGSREFIRASVDYDGVENSPDLFNLIVQRTGGKDSSLVEDQEIFSAASTREDSPRFIQALLGGSRLVRLRATPPSMRPARSTSRHPGDPLGYTGLAVMGSDGEHLTDYDLIGQRKTGSGLFALDAASRIDVVCIPPAAGRTVGLTAFLAAQRYCELRRALLIWDPPEDWTNPDMALAQARQSLACSNYAMTYFPRVQTLVAGSTQPAVVPACGALAGLMAGKAQRGDWDEITEQSPYAKISLPPAVRLSAAEGKRLVRAGVNVLLPTAFGSSMVRGNTTLAGNRGVSELWSRLDRRLLSMRILKTVEELASQPEPVADFDEFAGKVRVFMEDLVHCRALAGSTAEQAFSLQRVTTHDASLRLRLGLALERPAKFLCYEFNLAAVPVRARRVAAVETEEQAG